MNAWFAALAERERRLVIWGAIGAAILIVLLVLVPLHSKTASAAARVAKKSSDLTWMRSVAPQLANAGPAAETPASQESLVALVDRAAREAQLGDSLVSSDPSGEGGLRVRMEQARFDVMVAWLARLREQHGVQVVSATVEGAGEAGIVDASFVLRPR